MVLAAAPSAAVADDEYFASSVFSQRLTAAAPVDGESPVLVKQLTNLAFGLPPETSYDCRHAIETQPSRWTEEERANCAPVTTRASISSDGFAPNVYEVGPDQPLVPVTLDGNSPSLARVLAAGVPIPPDAVPSSGSDGQLIIWQPATDTMWEFWRARRDASGNWHTGWGGRMSDVSQNPGHFEDVVDPLAPAGRPAGELFLEHHSWGGPASSIPNLPGLVTIDDLRAGVIDHALVFSTWTNAPGSWVWPAQRTDGSCRGAADEWCADIPQGARFRLDPDYPVASIADPVVRMFAKAAQDYGMILNNTTGGGLSFYAEGWRGREASDPYRGAAGLLTGGDGEEQPSLYLRQFPWENLELLEMSERCTDRSVECAPPPWQAELDEPAPEIADIAPELRLAAPRRHGAVLVVRGEVPATATGVVEVELRGSGSRSKLSRTHTARIVGGAFVTRIRMPARLREHRATVTASWSSPDGPVLSDRRRLR